MKFFDQLPDAWFDILVRLVPGVFTVVVLKTYGRLPMNIGYDQPVFLVLVAYTIGHFLQPGASYAARLAQQWTLDVDLRPHWRFLKGSFESIKGQATSLSRNVKLAEKAYAESASFFAIAESALIIVVWFKIAHPCENVMPVFGTLCVGLFLGFERSSARVRKMRDVVTHGQ